MSDKFTAILDKASEALLKEAGLSNPAEIGLFAPSDGDTATAALAEKVKAFEAVVRYAEKRAALSPPEKEKSRIEQMREALTGEAPSKPRKSGAKAAEPT
jgi:hypothetical protein